MRFTTAALPSSQWILVALATLVLAFAALALVWAGGTPASAQDDTEKPAKPAGLQVTTEASSLEASVDWDDVAGADEYRVRWRTKDGDLNAGVRPTSSNTTITVDDYGQWVVRVQACNQAGCSGPVAQTFHAAPAST